MRKFLLTQRDIDCLKKIGLKRRGDCFASFSVNANHEIWVYVTRSWTKEEKRRYVSGQCPIIEQIAEEYLLARPEGGRVLVKRDGLFYRLRVGIDIPFAEVEFAGVPGAFCEKAVFSPVLE